MHLKYYDKYYTNLNDKTNYDYNSNILNKKLLKSSDISKSKSKKKIDLDKEKINKQLLFIKNYKKKLDSEKEKIISIIDELSELNYEDSLKINNLMQNNNLEANNNLINNNEFYQDYLPIHYTNPI